ncbi:MAG: 2-hydroxy-3-oxopropionate reductase [Anaerolineae bacterium]
MKRVGFIGLGLMGKPMTRNLMRAGYPLTVHNRSRGPVDELVAEGATPAASPKEVAAQVDVVITCLPDSPDVELVALGPDGIIQGGHPGLTLIDMSTIAPAAALRIAGKLAERGIRWLDAPVSGGDIGARQGTLAIMVGGDEEVFQDCLELFQAMGKNIVRVGGNGAGQVAKACNQIVVAGTMAAMGEALVLAAKAGADVERVVEAIRGGAARCWALEVRAPQILRRDLGPGFKARMQYKDLNIILDAGKTYQVSLPVTGAVRELYTAMMAAGRGELDNSAIVTVLEDLAHVQVGSREEEV